MGRAKPAKIDDYQGANRKLDDPIQGANYKLHSPRTKFQHAPDVLNLTATAARLPQGLGPRRC
jgi:hypothetical protein